MAYHGCVQFGISYRADAKCAAESVPADDVALHRLPRDQVRQRLRGLLAAGIGVAILLTGLPTFGSVDPVKPNWNAADLDCVGIHDVGFAGQRGRRSRTNQEKE